MHGLHLVFMKPQLRDCRVAKRMHAVETGKSEVCQRQPQPEEGKKCIRQPSKGRSSTNRVLKVAIKYHEIPEGMDKELTTMTRGQTLKSTLSNELVTLEKIVAQLPHAFARNYIPIFRTVAHLQ